MQHTLSNLTKLCTITTVLLLTACGGGGERDDDDANNNQNLSTAYKLAGGGEGENDDANNNLNSSTAYKLAGTGTPDAANGQTLYNAYCASCHGASYANAKDSTKTLSAIAGNKGGMGSLSATIKTQQSNNIAYYLANGNPVATTSTTSTSTSTSTTSSVVSTTSTTTPASASATIGKDWYNSTFLTGSVSCATCHTSTPSQNISKVLNGANNAAVIQNAIDNKMGGMGVYIGYITPEQLNDIAAYLATP